MIVRCIDFETTGFPPRAGVCEVGWTDVQPRVGEPATIYPTVEFLCNPGMPIGEGALAVHGISDAMVADMPPTLDRFIIMAEGADVFCAHNAEFEQNFFGGGGRSWICTYKVALVLYPDLPNHRNGTIPQHLGIELDPAQCAPLHRAGPDTYVTAMILRRFLSDGATVERMVEITKRPKSITRLPFGRLKGALISSLTDAQLRNEINWITRAPDVRAALQGELDRRLA